MIRRETDVLVIGSGAGGATTAARAAAGGRSVLVIEEGPRVDPDALDPFSLEEMVAKYRHRGGAAAVGAPLIAYAEGRCVGGSTEINSGLWHRLPRHLTEHWRKTYRIDDFRPDDLDHFAAEVEKDLSVGYLPGSPPRSSELLRVGANRLGWRNSEFPRVFAYDTNGHGVKQTMSRTLLPRAEADGAEVLANTRIARIDHRRNRAVAALGACALPDGHEEPVRIEADHIFVCGGAIQSPALLQRSGIRRRIGGGLKLHPTIKIAARFREPVDHDAIPVDRITEFAPHITIGGSASRRGHVAVALAETGAPFDEALDDWKSVSVYYAAIRSRGSGRVFAVPGMKAPIVTYRLYPEDVSKLARGLVALGQVLLAAGAYELYPSVTGAGIGRSLEDLGRWGDCVSTKTANLMTIHMTSSIRMGEDQLTCGADSFGRVHGFENLRVNDASLIPDAPGVNPQAGVMSIAARNVSEFLV